MTRAFDLYRDVTQRGISAIDDFILRRESEGLYLDFKRAVTQPGVRGLDDRDANNLGKAISGFANSDGGIIIWGVDCRAQRDGADVAGAKCPITDTAHFRSLLEACVGRLTAPSHNGVVSSAITIGSGPEGFVVTLIPPSDNPPVQWLSDSRYYMRAGSSFHPMIHAVLAGMFGRRPPPRLSITVSRSGVALDTGDGMQAMAEISVRNEGLGIADGVFVTIGDIVCPEHCRVDVLRCDDERLGAAYKHNNLHSVISHPTFRLPPAASLAVLNITITLKLGQWMFGDMRMMIGAGASNGMPVHKEWSVPGTVFDAAIGLHARKLAKPDAIADKALGLTTP
jgi:hypothetical protein